VRPDAPHAAPTELDQVFKGGSYYPLWGGIVVRDLCHERGSAARVGQPAQEQQAAETGVANEEDERMIGAEDGWH
jgi:hypothetical protein